MKSEETASNRIVASLFGIALCVAGTGYHGAAEAADWPNWRGPNHNGISAETGWLATWPKEGPKISWKKPIGTGFCSIAVRKKRLYTMGNINNNDTVYCLDADTGKEVWKQSYPCPLFDKSHEGGPAATPTVDGGSVYTFSKNGDVYCFKAATGEEVWHRNITKELGVEQPSWYFAGSSLVVDNMVIFNAATQGVALDRADGSLIWQNGKKASGYATPVPFVRDGQKCVAIFTAKAITGLAAVTGKQIWKFTWETPWDENIADPIISGNHVFISSGCGKGCALLKIDGSDVTRLWQNKNMQNHLNSSVLWKGYLYGVDEKQLACLDFKTGQVAWTKTGLGKGSLLLADGKLIILSEKGKLVTAEASPEGFKELASWQILTGKCWTVPVLANGRIYARNANGDLVCVDVRASAAAVAGKTGRD